MNKEMLSPTWLNGKYKDVNGFNVEINTSLSYISFDCINNEDESYYFQGDEADNVIDEINAIYNRHNLTQSEAIARWINLYL